MKNLVLLAAMALSCATTPAQSSNQTAKSTPAASSIAAARQAISDHPKDPGGHDLLAMAFLRRARETGDDGFLAQADSAVNKALELAPGDFESQKTQVYVFLARHLYREALAEATALHKKTPDDVLVHGQLSEADAALGDYKEAETHAEWMLNLRRGNVPGYIVGAQLREAFGVIDGAYEFWNLALQSTPDTETEDRAWLLTHMARVRLMTGKLDDADKLCQQALTAFPDYYFTLEVLGRVRLEQKRNDDAVAFFRQVYKVVPHTANLYLLAGALRAAGHESEAAKAYADFESQALRMTDAEDNCNRELVFYYLDVAHKPAQALQVAQREYAWRKDVYTLDAYAWALQANGQDAEARKQIELALAEGTKDGGMFLRAGEIALKLGDRAAAASYFKKSAELNTLESEKARTQLAALPAQPAKSNP